MPNVYVEAVLRAIPKEAPSRIFVVEDGADSVLGTLKTQQEAIAWERMNSRSPLVTRVRHLNDKKIPDHWRSV